MASAARAMCFSSDNHERFHASGLPARGKVLVVEDERDIREALAEALSYEGYDVVIAANGREALGRLCDGGSLPDVILLDLVMPEMNGWEFRQVQVHDPALAGIPVVVVSASDPGNARPDRHLPKPFAIDELFHAVAQLVRH
jgi:CheY-like chemotaxis protein